MHFLDIEAGQHIRLYRQGVTSVSAADVYAGLLVGMHWDGLYRSRWSAPGGGSRVGKGPEARAAQDRVVRSEQRRWADAAELAWTEQEPRAAFETRLWHNYELLQLWDLLSLFLSVSLPSRATGRPSGGGRSSGTWSTRQDRWSCPPWVRGPAAPASAPTACATAPGMVSLDPFPFTAPVTVEVEHVVIPDREWSRAGALREVRRTPTTATTWRLVPAASGEGRT